MRKKKSARGLIVAVAALTLLAVLAACASGGSYNAYEEDPKFNMLVTAFDSDDASNIVIRGESSAAASASEASAAMYDAAPEADMLAEVTSERFATDSASGGGGSVAPAATERKIITTVTLNMESKEYDSTAHRIYAAVEAAGGYIEYSDIAGNIRAEGVDGVSAVGGMPGVTLLGGDVGSGYYREGNRRYLFLRIRVPQAGLPGFLGQVEGYGNVLTKQENAEDVTLQYVDTEARLNSLRIEQEQLMEMLGQAENVETIIALQQRLAEVRYQIESYQSQLRVMDNQVSYATVNLTLNEVLVYSEPPVENPTVGQRIANGFARTLADIRNFWVNQFVWVAVNSIYIGVAVVVIVVLLLLFRRWLKRHPYVPKEAPAADGSGTEPDKLAESADGAANVADAAKKNDRP